jgi:hypothetical protein
MQTTLLAQQRKRQLQLGLMSGVELQCWLRQLRWQRQQRL